MEVSITRLEQPGRGRVSWSLHHAEGIEHGESLAARLLRQGQERDSDA
jgi:hypothetical protein